MKIGLIILLVGAMAESTIDLIFRGLALEAREYPDTVSQCEIEYEDVNKALEDLLDTNQRSQDIWDTLEYLKFFSNDAVHFSTACGFRPLYKKIANTFTVSGIEELTARTIFYLQDLRSLYEAIFDSIEDQDYDELGKCIAKGLKILYNYSLA